MATKRTAAPKASSSGTSNLPAQYQEQMAREMEEIQKRIAAPSGDRVRFTKTGFRTPDGMEGEELEVVIIDFVSSNLFYDGPYDRDNPAPPGCFAIGNEPSTLVPSDNSPNKQSDSCSVCPNNQFGSSGKGKACKNTRLLAVTPAEPDSEGNYPVWIMAVPPTSIKMFDAYVSKIAKTHKVPPIGVVTRVTMDDAVDYAAPRFSAVRPVDKDDIGTFFELRNDAHDRLYAEPDVSQYNAAPAKSKPAARRR